MKDYGKVMLVCNMKHESSHNNTAQECFQYDKTCAILPLAENTSSIVITVNASESERLLALDDMAFCAEAESMLNHRLGKMTLISQPIAYPLVGVMSDRFIGQNFALIGDAAVGMHPVTAHGFNLGLRSADTLAQLVIKAHKKGRNIASKRLLHEYEARHKLLSKPLYDATNAIVALYTNKKPWAKVVRKVGIRLGNKALPFKKLVTHRLTQIR
jgi:ubiquinone biosynthesis UbiH/UbiF/VisC/COQ6 family hydroxylase